MNCIWLIPEAPELGILRGLIDRLASVGGGPRFEPHVTILSGIALDAADLKDRLKSDLEKFPKFEISLAATETGTDFFKAFYLVPEPSEILDSLRRRAEKLAEPDLIVSRFDPHISLAYGNFADTERQRMREITDRALPLAVRFKRASVVRAAGSIPVASWTPVNSIFFKCDLLEDSSG
ncbi:MAG: 2'-5' RNA ligase family protein [Albidovulum sp.]|nr:2'-5' RNA ligase family protein [Albidovulum sp.]